MDLRQTRVVVALTLMLLLLIGSSASAEKQRVTFQVIWGAGTEYVAFRDLVEDFNRQSETIEVELLPGEPSIYFDRLQTQAAAGVMPDLFVAGIDAPYALVEGGYLVDIAQTSLAEQLPWDSYIPVMRENVYYGEHWYTVPWFLDNTWLLYNRSLFGQLGLDEDTAPGTWGDVREIGIRASNSGPSGDEQRRYGLFTQAAGHSGAAWWFLPWAWQAGGSFFDPDTHQATVNHPAVARALRFLEAGVKESTYILPAGVNAEATISRGDLAMWHALPVHASQWERFTGEKPGTAMLPRDEVPATQIGGWHLYLFDTENRDATLEFVAWLTDVENQARYVMANRSIPPRTDIITDSVAFRDYLAENPELMPLMNQVEYSRLVHPELRRAPLAGISVESVLGQAIQAVFHDGEPVESALLQAQDLLNTAYQAWRLAD